MILFVLRKMLANKWMVASLLIGVILAVAMVTTIPIYSHAILTRMLVRDLQIYQENSRVYPGGLSVSGYITLNEFGPDRLEWIDDLSSLVRNEVPRGLPVPTLTESVHLQQNFLRVERLGTESPSVAVSVGAMTGLMERVVPVAGTLPVRSDPADSSPVIEAAIIRQTAAEGRVVFGETYRLLAPRTEEPFGYPIRIVGVIDMEDPTDLFWSYSLNRHGGVLLVHPDDLRRVIVHENPGRNIEASWNYTFDYHQLSSEQIAPFVRFIQQYVIAARSLGLTIRLPALRIMEQYLERERQLVMTLWVLQAPLLLMLTFYLFMVSQVLIDHERNEIALMKSRGANIGQVFQTYVILGSFLSAVGFILGPLLGLAICRVLGASSGFLEFVQRRALRVVLTPRATLYAFIASMVSLVTILIPALGASRITIVEHKQTRARARKRALWKVLFLDVVLIAIAGYGLYQFSVRSEILQLSGLEATDLALDPILLVMSTIFVVGVGLLFLRVYPVFVRALYRIGARSWSPAFFASLIQVGRGGGKDQFLMLFIILSIAIGVYNADAARTLNQNVEEQLRYGIGADIVLQEQWQQVNPDGTIVVPDAMGFGSGGPPDPAASAGSPRYLEPPFRRFQELPGVSHVTPVFRATNAAGRSFAGTSFGRVSLYGIVPHEFGRVAWFRDGLLPSHWFNYLNLLSHSPAAALVSRSLAEEADLSPGDPIYLRWGDQPLTLYYVYGVVDYWPGYNPFAGAGSGAGARQHLAVVNLNYMHATTALEPYQVWFALDDGVTSAEFYDTLTVGRINPTRVQDASQELIRRRNDPMLQGTNGTLSLGFLVSLGICFVGFLLYWVFSIRDRTLQFGLFRAMGMSKSSIIGMLGLEQLFVSGAAVAAGFAIGRLASELFVPLLQAVRSAEQAVPPFRVVSLGVDQLRITIFVTVMLLFGFGILSVVLSRIKIHQAVKLGEE